MIISWVRVTWAIRISGYPLLKFSDFFGFFSTWGRFGEDFGGQYGGQNRFLGGSLAMFFSNAFWHRFWVVFSRVESWKIIKNHWFFNGFCYFSKKRRFRKSIEKSSILGSISEPKTMKNREKSLQTANSSKGAPKMRKKCEKIAKKCENWPNMAPRPAQEEGDYFLDGVREALSGLLN